MYDLVFTDSSAALLRLDLTTRDISVISGGLLVRPYGVTDGTGSIVYVTDTGSLSVVAIDTTTGEQAILVQGGILGVPYGIAREADGRILVVNGQYLVRIDPAAGEMTILSSDDHFGAPLGVAVAPDGQIYVADAFKRIIRVDPATGTQTLISEGIELVTPVNITVADNRTLYVADGSGSRVVRVNVKNGAQTLVSQGEKLATPVGIAVLDSRTLLVGDPDAFDLRGGIIAIDTRTGEQTELVRGFQDLVNPRCIALIPRQ